MDHETFLKRVAEIQQLTRNLARTIGVELEELELLDGSEHACVDCHALTLESAGKSVTTLLKLDDFGADPDTTGRRSVETSVRQAVCRLQSLLE